MKYNIVKVGGYFNINDSKNNQEKRQEKWEKR